MNISVIGMRGAGKGTHANQLAKDFNLASFSPGDVLRAGVKQRTPLGKTAQKYVERGELVPDDIIIEFVEEWIWTTSPNQGIIFDGFPRTTYQAEHLEHTLTEMDRKFDLAVYLDISEDLATQRLSERRICHRCLREFHLTSAPFEKCPIRMCQGEHLRHPDDETPDSLRVALEAFRCGIEALLKYYRPSGKLTVIDGNGPIDKVHNSIVEVLMPYR